MVRVQCQSNLLHQTTNGDNTGRTPEASFSWSSNSASFVAAKVLLANYYIRTILLEPRNTLIIMYFLWDLHYYFNLQDSKCCTKIDRTKQDVLDNLVRYRLFNASIFQQIETYLSTTTVMYKLDIFL